jgi:hypothetical protein
MLGLEKQKREGNRNGTHEHLLEHSARSSDREKGEAAGNISVGSHP